MDIQTTDRDKKIARVSEFTDEQVAIIKSTVAKNTTDTELAFFLNICRTTNLNPFTKEIWCYKDNKDNLICFAGRDGFLTKAQQTSRWNGVASSEVREKDKFIADIPNGRITHEFDSFNERGKIVGAYAICKPKGCEIATIETVRFDTYDKGQFTWKTQSADMIKKVAEIKAHKKAYGISGIQSEYEFNVVNETVYPIDTENKLSTSKVAYAEGLILNSLYNDDQRDEIQTRLEDSELTETELNDIISDLKHNQLDPIDQGAGYSQTEINSKLDKIK